MNTISSKLTALAAALVMNGLILGAVGYLFEIQAHPQMSVVSIAPQVGTHQWSQRWQFGDLTTRG
ncbi:MAG: hypothetical protein ABI145_02540 [Steroidobacteraceae bacterium]